MPGLCRHARNFWWTPILVRTAPHTKGSTARRSRYVSSRARTIEPPPGARPAAACHVDLRTRTIVKPCPQTARFRPHRALPRSAARFGSSAVIMMLSPVQFDWVRKARNRSRPATAPCGPHFGGMTLAEDRGVLLAHAHGEANRPVRGRSAFTMKHTNDSQHDVVASATPLDVSDHSSAERGIRTAASSALLGDWVSARRQVLRWRAKADRLARGASAEKSDVEFATTTDARQDGATRHIVWIRY